MMEKLGMSQEITTPVSKVIWENENIKDSKTTRAKATIAEEEGRHFSLHKIISNSKESNKAPKRPIRLGIITK